MQPSDVHFGVNLKDVRKKKRITLQRLADLSGVSLAVIKSTESEKHSTLPGLYNACCLAHAVGCSLDELCREPGKHTEADSYAFLIHIKDQIGEFFAA